MVIVEFLSNGDARSDLVGSVDVWLGKTCGLAEQEIDKVPG